MDYMRFTGLLHSDGSFDRGMGWTTPRIRKPGKGDSPFVVELLGSSGEPLNRARVTASRRGDPSGEFGWPAYFLVAYIPLVDGASAIRLTHRDRLIHHEHLAAKPPSLSIPTVDCNGHTAIARWDAEHNLAVQFHVYATHEESTTYTVALGLDEPIHSFELAALPSDGAWRVSVLATDGLRSTTATSEPFDVLVAPPTTVAITAPRADQLVSPLDMLELEGFATAAPGTRSPGPPVWSLDGEPVARGSWIAAIDPPPPGGHTLEVAAGTGEGAAASVQFTVREPTSEDADWTRVAAEIENKKHLH